MSDKGNSAINANLELVTTVFSLPFIISDAYITFKMVRKDTRTIYKLNALQVSLLLLNSITMLLVHALSGGTCFYVFTSYNILSFLSVGVIFSMAFIKAYLCIRNARPLLYFFVLLQTVRGASIIQFFIQPGIEGNIMGGCLWDNPTVWVITLLGAEALGFIVFTFITVYFMSQQLRQKGSRIYIIFINDGLIFSVTISIFYIVATVLQSLAIVQSSIILYMVWIACSKFATMQTHHSFKWHHRDFPSEFNIGSTTNSTPLETDETKLTSKDYVIHLGSSRSSRSSNDSVKADFVVMELDKVRLAPSK
ncbi:hypothetical protein K7432_000744 [Basidiobolus ranarum]|uniref:Uncharacterized protein n=1 Tax=Basidiobolus ranarum TaxID=34480 RepID=A0ABR2X4F9_9FUNG